MTNANHWGLQVRTEVQKTSGRKGKARDLEQCGKALDTATVAGEDGDSTSESGDV